MTLPIFNVRLGQIKRSNFSLQNLKQISLLAPHQACDPLAYHQVHSHSLLPKNAACVFYLVRENKDLRSLFKLYIHTIENKINKCTYIFALSSYTNSKHFWKKKSQSEAKLFLVRYRIVIIYPIVVGTYCRNPIRKIVRIRCVKNYRI